MKAKIIIVEDHESIRNELKILLSKYGYEIIVLDRFDTVVEDCLREDVDLILLDINLPFYDGYYVCRAIREKSEVPIIVVTSRDSEMDELMSINLGADDFITKPYNTQILLARISAMLKRTHKEKVNDFLQYQGLKLQLNSSTVIYKDQIIELSKNEMRILYTLLQHKESIVSRDQLMESLWQSNEFIDDNTLTVNVNRVRKKLEAAGLILENHPSEITRAMDEEMQQINYYLEQALYYARSNSVEKDYLVKELSLKEVVENAVKANAKSLIGNKIKIKIENLDQKIFSDEKWVLFILNQVISNAIKYKKEEAEISFCARCEKNEILLEIRDNGIGISPKDLPRITDKGYTGTTGRNYQKSTGMGLYLCKKLCSKLQLSFYIESKEEEYTKVTIGFPRNSMIFFNEE